MTRTVRTVVTILFLGIVIGCGLAVLYFGTSTGVISGGATTVTGGATKSAPFYAQVGWVRNTAPWPVTIQKITTNAAHTSAPTVTYIERKHDSTKYKSGAAPTWTKISPTPPVEILGGSLHYLGFAVSPAVGHIASFTSFTVKFSGPLGFTFSKTFSGTIIAARAAGLPPTILAPDPLTNSASLDPYLTLLRTALEQKNLASLATVMGGDATVTDAKAFLAKQQGFTAKYKQLVTFDLKNPDSQTIVFYRSDPKKGQPPIIVNWAGFRWSVAR
ncbi:MAG TPA: hypothetical protein VGM94_09760 [Galbitalea sp.]